MTASINAWQFSKSTPVAEEEDNIPYFVRVLGYCGLTFSVMGMAVAAALVWVREGAPEAAAMLSWAGSLNPLVLGAVLGPAAALILVGEWMQRRALRKAQLL